MRHWRDTQGGGYALNDERDSYELVANMAARRVRACLEEIIDSDIIADAVDQCRKTLREGEKIPLKDRAVQMVTAFAEFGVTAAMIEARIGNKLEAVSENQLASLRRVFKGLKDKCATGRASDIPAWMQDLENTPERVGRGQDKEQVVEQLRALGYM